VAKRRINMGSLLPNKYKIPGIIMVVVGLVLAVAYFMVDFRFEFPVFAVVSSYMNTNFFTTFKTNFAHKTHVFDGIESLWIKLMKRLCCSC